MLDGEATYLFCQVFQNEAPPNTPSIVLPNARLNSCCDTNSWQVLADVNSTDEFQNDITGVLFWFKRTISSATMVLEKFVNGSFGTIDALDNNDNGVLYPFAFFTNEKFEKFLGYQIEWKKVLTAFGAGSYRVKCTYSAGDLYSREFCVQQYSAGRANGTIRIEYNLSGWLGSAETDYEQRHYGSLFWRNQIRVNGFFAYEKSAYENSYTQYENGQSLYVESDQEPQYTCTLKSMPFFKHDILRIDVMQADRIAITDYNNMNATTLANKEVQPTSEYAPNWFYLQNKNASVQLTFRQTFNNLKKLRY